MPSSITSRHRLLFRDTGVTVPNLGWDWIVRYLGTGAQLWRNKKPQELTMWSYCVMYIELPDNIDNCFNYLMYVSRILFRIVSDSWVNWFYSYISTQLTDPHISRFLHGSSLLLQKDISVWVPWIRSFYVVIHERRVTPILPLSTRANQKRVWVRR